MCRLALCCIVFILKNIVFSCVTVTRIFELESCQLCTLYLHAVCKFLYELVIIDFKLIIVKLTVAIKVKFTLLIFEVIVCTHVLHNDAVNKFVGCLHLYHCVCEK